jgi:uncharacterized protein
MKLLSDVNIVLSLTAECSLQHVAIRSWWEFLPETQVLYICRPVQMGLIRLLCTEAVMGDDTLTFPQAWNIYANLLASGRFSFVPEPPLLDATWAGLSRAFGRSPKVVMDAYLAAFAITGGYHLVTMDKAFGQFKGLEWTLVK